MSADLYINDAGTARRTRQIYVNDNGTARRIKEIWVNDSGTARQIYANGDVSLVSGTFTNSGYGLSFYELRSNGVLSAANVTDTLWINPAGGMWQYEVLATHISFLGAGSTTGTTGSWLPLTATRSWAVNRPSAAGPGSDSWNFSLQIRRAIDSVVVASANVTITSSGP